MRAFKLRDEVSIAADLEVLLQLCVLDFDGLLVLLVERHESLLLTSGKSKISDVESFQSEHAIGLHHCLQVEVDILAGWLELHEVL